MHFWDHFPQRIKLNFRRLVRMSGSKSYHFTGCHCIQYYIISSETESRRHYRETQQFPLWASDLATVLVQNKGQRTDRSHFRICGAGAPRACRSPDGAGGLLQRQLASVYSQRCARVRLLRQEQQLAPILIAPTQAAGLDNITLRGGGCVLQ